MAERAAQFRQRFAALEAEIGKVIVGQPDIVHGVLTCLFVGGHALLEGVPGLGKTLLVRTLSQVLDLKFNRIQFTPDLMPSDIIGTNIITETPDGRRDFRFQSGPALRPDRAGRRDQPRHARRRSRPCWRRCRSTASPSAAPSTGWRSRSSCMATQNPIEQEGTYPLPEAQLDRFFFKLLVQFTTREELATDPRPHDPQRVPAAGEGDGRRRDHAVAAAGPRGAGGAAGAGLRDPAGAGDAPAGRVRHGRRQPLHPLRGQPARAQALVLAGEGAGAAGRPVQRQLRGRPRRCTCRRCGTASC